MVMIASPGMRDPAIETMDRDDLDALSEERIRYTVQYAEEHSPFYRRWFAANGVSAKEIRTHDDLLKLPIVSGSTIRSHQPPVTRDFGFLSVPCADVFTIHETSGTTGVPKAFFLTWEDWTRYAEKYARSFASQGLGNGDRVVVCTSYGMNVGGNTMTVAAHRLKMTIIPTGKCTFPSRIITSYRPTAIVGSVFKLLHLAERLEREGIDPRETSIGRLVVGGESFAEASRKYLSERWDCPVYNTYGSTEGTMCGECTAQDGLHVPEDMVHLDLYDPEKREFVPDGAEGRIVLSHLLPVGARSGMVLLNYDSEDITSIVSREKCACGRTHLRIRPPRRENDRLAIGMGQLDRTEIERAVFNPDNMEDLTGEYEAFLYGDGDTGALLRVGLECWDPAVCDRSAIQERMLETLAAHNPMLASMLNGGEFRVLFSFTGQGGLDLHQVKGRPKRLVDRR
jgi:coenzyme F390 synthetase